MELNIAKATNQQASPATDLKLPPVTTGPLNGESRAVDSSMDAKTLRIRYARAVAADKGLLGEFGVFDQAEANSTDEAQRTVIQFKCGMEIGVQGPIERGEFLVVTTTSAETSPEMRNATSHELERMVDAHVLVAGTWQEREAFLVRQLGSRSSLDLAKMFLSSKNEWSTGESRPDWMSLEELGRFRAELPRTCERMHESVAAMKILAERLSEEMRACLFNRPEYFRAFLLFVIDEQYRANGEESLSAAQFLQGRLAIEDASTDQMGEFSRNLLTDPILEIELVRAYWCCKLLAHMKTGLKIPKGPYLLRYQPA